MWWSTASCYVEDLKIKQIWFHQSEDECLCLKDKSKKLCSIILGFIINVNKLLHLKNIFAHELSSAHKTFKNHIQFWLNILTGMLGWRPQLVLITFRSTETLIFHFSSSLSLHSLFDTHNDFCLFLHENVSFQKSISWIIIFSFSTLS